MNPEVWTTRKAQKYVRRNNRTKRTVCTDLDHARNLAKKIIRQERGTVTRLVVWIDETHRAVWTDHSGWSEVEESNRRNEWLKTGR